MTDRSSPIGFTWKPIACHRVATAYVAHWLESGMGSRAEAPENCYRSTPKSGPTLVVQLVHLCRVGAAANFGQPCPLLPAAPQFFEAVPEGDLTKPAEGVTPRYHQN